jgi:hypothetical protein
MFCTSQISNMSHSLGEVKAIIREKIQTVPHKTLQWLKDYFTRYLHWRRWQFYFRTLCVCMTSITSFLFHGNTPIACNLLVFRVGGEVADSSLGTSVPWRIGHTTLSCGPVADLPQVHTHTRARARSPVSLSNSFLNQQIGLYSWMKAVQAIQLL